MTRPLPATFKPEHTVLGYTVGLNGLWVAYVIPGASAAMPDADGHQRYLSPGWQRFAVMVHQPERPDFYDGAFPTVEGAIHYTQWLTLWRARMTRLPWPEWLRQTRQCGQQERGGEQ